MKMRDVVWAAAYCLIGLALGTVLAPGNSVAIPFTGSPTQLSVGDKKALALMTCKASSDIGAISFEAYRYVYENPPRTSVTIRCASRKSSSGFPVRFTIFCNQTNIAWSCEGGRNLLEYKDAWATLYFDTASDVPPIKEFEIIKDLLESDHDSRHPIHQFYDQVEFSMHAIAADRFRLDSNRGTFVIARECRTSRCRYKLDVKSSTIATP